MADIPESIFCFCLRTCIHMCIFTDTTAEVCPLFGMNRCVRVGVGVGECVFVCVWVLAYFFVCSIFPNQSVI